MFFFLNKEISDNSNNFCICFLGYRWDECEFSPLSCLLRR
ncbi:unnamed protein product [Brugia pahangi]|uniref:EGF-like domain-containing protein n=1 Tax=Brugia pahangi TaxID=6280 RepID=A0A0N4T4R0_BRUPA|nr:unnamed protein product [Brugia pahangi]